MRLPAFALGLALCGPLIASTVVSPALGDTMVLMSSNSDRISYGLLVMAPEQGCVASRVVVRGTSGLWRTPTLPPGGLAVVRMGRGFAPGDHLLTLQTAGCAAESFAARRVVLGKSSPDHGWRAGGVKLRE